MKVGVGLPSTIPGVDRDSLLTWARKAEERGFSTLGTIDRVVYGNYESLIALAAAAAVTERIRLTTDILLGPLRGNGAMLAKQAATIDSLSNGRLTLGIAVGLREDDYAATATPFDERGKVFDAQLAEMRRDLEGARSTVRPVPSGRRPRAPTGPSSSSAARSPPPSGASPTTATAGRWEAARLTSSRRRRRR